MLSACETSDSQRHTITKCSVMELRRTAWSSLMTLTLLLAWRMSGYEGAYQWLESSRFRSTLVLGRATEGLLLAVECALEMELNSQVWYLPL